MFKISIITASFERTSNLEKLYKNLKSQIKDTFLIEWVLVLEKKDKFSISYIKNLNKLKNLKIKVVLNKKPGKFSSLVKTGISNSNGEYVVVVGDDDKFYKNALQNIFNLIKKKNYPSMVIGYGNYINQDGIIIRKYLNKFKKFILNLNSRFLLGFFNYYMCPAVFIKRDALITVDYFSENYSNINDFYTWVQLRNHYKPQILKKDISYVGFEEGTISHSFNFIKYVYMWKIFLTSNNFILLIPFKLLLSLLILVLNYLYRINKIIFNLIFKPNRFVKNCNQVIHITRSFNRKKYGGIEEVIKQICKNSNFNHKILFIDEKEKENFNKDHYSVSFIKTFELFGDLFSFRLLEYLYKNQNQYNTIIIHYPHVLAFLYLLLLPFRKKVIVVYHSDIMRQMKIQFIIDLILLFMNRYIYKYYISSQKYLKNSKIKNYRNKSVVEFFSISLKTKNFITRNETFTNKPYVLFIGRNTYYKGYSYLENIITKCKNIKFICVTDYKFRNTHKNLVHLKNISEAKKYNLIKNCYIMISTSKNRAESFGMSMLEGLFFNKPLICFDIKTGINEIVLNNRNGYCIQKFDISDYVNKINLLLTDKKLYKKFSAYSSKHKMKFKKTYRKFESLLIETN